MDSDEQAAISDPEESAWVVPQRQRVVEYLASQQVQHAGVSVEPRWFLSPYVAIWAVRSKANPDRIGSWAISGDLPTDYITCTHEQNNADVLLSFSRQWKTAAAQLSKGISPPGYQIGPRGREKELAPLLLSRANAIEKFANDMKSEARADEG